MMPTKERVVLYFIVRRCLPGAGFKTWYTDIPTVDHHTYKWPYTAWHRWRDNSRDRKGLWLCRWVWSWRPIFTCSLKCHVHAYVHVYTYKDFRVVWGRDYHVKPTAYTCSYKHIETSVHGYHVYCSMWNMRLGEVLYGERDPEDEFAIAMKASGLLKDYRGPYPKRALRTRMALLWDKDGVLCAWLLVKEGRLWRIGDSMRCTICWCSKEIITARETHWTLQDFNIQYWLPFNTQPPIVFEWAPIVWSEQGTVSFIFVSFWGTLFTVCLPSRGQGSHYMLLSVHVHGQYKCISVCHCRLVWSTSAHTLWTTWTQSLTL